MLRFTLGSVGVFEVCLVGFYKGGLYKGFKGFIVVFPGPTLQCSGSSAWCSRFRIFFFILFFLLGFGA